MIIAISAITVLIAICVVIYRHQLLLKDRAELMHDAMRHRDFSFRLPTKGLLFGERALQQALNNMGEGVEKLVAHNEVESWQRLTRVLTHEIMNATTPIRSISQAYLADPDIKGTPYEEGIQAILDTSTGLAAFVDSYRKMTQLQEPVMEEIEVLEFCKSIAVLYPDLDWKIEVPGQLQLRCDPGLMRQVFMNLVKNAVEADARSIGVRYVKNGDSIPHSFGKLLISNDGHLISDEVAREVFIPFFTTKPHGSGIGLSLSRQILVMQGMILSLAPIPAGGYNVTFIIEKEIQ
ncbi:MAG: HAMP domain-containing histidine kinase [Bacteroidales bacterium]|nr:HAMP domain-containing histidine kinase [Bacteroidales bacterium]